MSTKGLSGPIHFAVVGVAMLLFCGLVAAQPIMYTHYIDVGQADATLLEFPCGAVLIDTGAQDNNHIDDLVDYLENFFSRRTDLNNTLNVVFVTHNHIDHTRAPRYRRNLYG